MSVLTLKVDEVMRTLSAESSNPFVVHDKEIDVVRFAINSGFADIVLDGQVALRVMYQRPGETEVRARTLTYYDTDGLHSYYDWQLAQSDLTKYGSLMVALCILDISGGEVSEWHTTPCAVRVLSTIHTDDSDEGDDTITPTVKERVAVLESMIQRVASGAPIVVASTSAMTDTDQIYVLKTDGKWYYHNGTAWVAGGEYGAVATDTTLTQAGIPADAEAVGDAIANITIIDVDDTLTQSGMAADAKTVGDEVNKINSLIYEKGESVSIQTVGDASAFVLNKPSGVVYVNNTNKNIFSGTPNIIDLFGLAQGVFSDSRSGVTIEIDGNNCYIHGDTTSEFRFDLQTGEFYTDSFNNHIGNVDILPDNTAGYFLCFFEDDGYTMPSNVYFGRLNEQGSAIAASPLSGHSGYFVKNNTYFALYSNGAITNLSVRFKFGLKIGGVIGTIAPIEGIPKMPYGTQIINEPGYYKLGNFTFTWNNAIYDVVKARLKIPQLTAGCKYVWFGDSISQLRELPNIVSEIIGAIVYDCSFAGSPLTYGDPTKYQPTGFMSLCSQIADNDFTPLSDALDAQEQSGVNVSEKRQHLATLQGLDFDTITDIVVLAGTNDFDNAYVNSTNFVSGFSSAIETILTAYPHLIIHVLSPIWRGDKTQGRPTIPTMSDLVELEKTVANTYNLPFADLYHTSGINSFTASVYLENDSLHLSAKGDAMLANRCAKALLSE